MGSHLSGTNHLPQPPDNTLPNAAQDIVDLRCDKNLLVAHIKLGVHQDNKVLLSKISSIRSVPCGYWHVRLFLPRFHNSIC